MLSMLREGESPQLAATIIIYLIVLLTALPVHEAAHGWAAYRMGDPTAKNAGRLTLNPVKHLDPFGVFLFLLTGFGFAKPVPVNPRYFKNPRAGMVLVSLAGPCSNLLLGWISMVLYKLTVVLMRCMVVWNVWLVEMLETMVVLNVGLAVFNLLPIPPLDGSRLLLAALKGKAAYYLVKYEQWISLGLMAVILLGWLDAPLGFLRSFVLSVMDLATRWIDAIWVLLK
ncbi:MAG: site-2 protease family protein [Massiliimalia sp.]